MSHTLTTRLPLVTSLIIALPHTVQAKILPLMQQLWVGQDVSQVVPHITILYPFVPLDQLDRAAEHLRDVLQHDHAFTVTLDRYTRWSDYLVLLPQETHSLMALRSRITAAFPPYLPYGGLHGYDPTPHVTLAYHPSDGTPDNLKMADVLPLSFTVDRIQANVGVPYTSLPWITNAVIGLKRHRP